MAKKPPKMISREANRKLHEVKVIDVGDVEDRGLYAELKMVPGINGQGVCLIPRDEFMRCLHPKMNLLPRSHPTGEQTLTEAYWAILDEPSKRYNITRIKDERELSLITKTINERARAALAPKRLLRYLTSR